MTESEQIGKNRKYNFLFISAPFGGIEVLCKNIQKVVDTKNDIEATWMWIDFQPKDFIARIPPISLNWTLKGGMIARTRLKKLEREGKSFDAVFANHTIPLMFLQRFRKNVPIILSLDITPELLQPYNLWYRGKSSNSQSFGSGIKHSMTRNVYNDASYILPWSQLVKRSLVNDYGVDTKKIEVVPPGIDVHQWNQSENNDGKKDQDSIHILFVGGDFLRKGGDLLLRVAARTEFQKCKFHFVTRSFQGMAGDNVQVYDNVQANSGELLGLYKMADIFALPTRADLSPAALCEAMAFRLPVVATNVGGLDEIILDGKNGFIVPADEEEEFALRLKTLVGSKELRVEFGRSGRALVEEKYDIQKNAEIILDYMKRAVHNNDDRKIIAS
ncbi:MAG: glycosyltransferase family 4 protein [Bacteroidota bacterium]|nr:glycosyltransferase family 4 protein [Bacteroidota bacterium]